MQYLIIGCGGILGSWTRFALGKYIGQRYKKIFPLGTFIINVTGSFFLGLLFSVHLEKNYALFWREGFCGSYTTFSTFIYEDLALLQQRNFLKAFSYLLFSFFFGIIGFAIGKVILPD